MHFFHSLELQVLKLSFTFSFMALEIKSQKLKFGAVQNILSFRR